MHDIMEAAMRKTLRWQWIIGPFVGILMASFLATTIKEPTAWFLGGILWGAIMAPTTSLGRSKQVAYVVSMGCVAGFVNWFIEAYF